MHILFNGKSIEVTPQAKISELFSLMGVDIKQSGMALALNEEILPKEFWNTILLHEGDSLELVHAIQGG